jgi:alanine racemase
MTGLEGPVALVDVGALRRNVAALRARLRPGAQLLAPVKADAYGHGAAQVAPALQAFGADRFGVATADEALELRRAGVTAPVLVFAPVHHRVAELAHADVALTIGNEAALRSLEAGAAGLRVRVHLKLDTGMGRLGVPAEDALALARLVAASGAAELEGVWTHLASSDDPDAMEEGTQTAR